MQNIALSFDGSSLKINSVVGLRHGTGLGEGRQSTTVDDNESGETWGVRGTYIHVANSGETQNGWN